MLPPQVLVWRISNELRRAYIRVALWWDKILDPTPDWPLITGEAETRMHVHDAKMENLIGHDKDLHISQKRLHCRDSRAAPYESHARRDREFTSAIRQSREDQNRYSPATPHSHTVVTLPTYPSRISL